MTGKLETFSKSVSKTIFLGSYLLLVALLMPVGEANAEDEYILISYSDVPGYSHIKAGDFEQAVVVTSALYADPHWQIAAANNLCVSYAKLKDYAKARKACSRAVSLERNSGIGTSSSQRSKRQEGIILSNRGVVRALAGNMEGAEKDFLMARRMSSEPSAISMNIAHFKNSRKTEKLAAKMSR